MSCGKLLMHLRIYLLSLLSGVSCNTWLKPMTNTLCNFQRGGLSPPMEFPCVTVVIVWKKALFSLSCLTHESQSTELLKEDRVEKHITTTRPSDKQRLTLGYLFTGLACSAKYFWVHVLAVTMARDSQRKGKDIRVFVVTPTVAWRPSAHKHFLSVFLREEGGAWA